MTHLITLEIPESIYQPLAEAAEAQGRRVEDIALEKLATNGSRDIDDPFAKFIGSFDSKGMDWGNRHDEYLGEGLMRELRGEAE